MYCQKCGKEINDDAVVCVHCGCAVNQAAFNQTAGMDKANVGLVILSFLFPLFGWIYGGIRYKDYPNSSKTYIGWGIGGFVFGLIVTAML